MGKEEWGQQIDGGWFDEERHLYRNEAGTIVPSTTQVFSILGCDDFSAINPDVLEWKRTYGTALHKCLELLVFDDLDWDTVDEKLIDPLVGIETFLKNHEYVGESAEQRKVHCLYGMYYGLTVDGIGEMTYQGKRRKVVFDLKTGTKFSPTWKWQIGSYTSAQEKAKDGWIGLVGQVTTEGRVIPHYVDLLSAQREFQYLLAAANLKINNGLAKIGKAA